MTTMQAYTISNRAMHWRFYSFVFGGLTGGIFVWGAKRRYSADCAKLRLPKAGSPSRLEGLGERRKLPQRGLGRRPRNRRDFEHFKPKWSTFWDPVNLTFKKKLNRRNSICLV